MPNFTCGSNFIVFAAEDGELVGDGQEREAQSVGVSRHINTVELNWLAGPLRLSHIRKPHI
jgi:hypothetical protein